MPLKLSLSEYGYSMKDPSASTRQAAIQAAIRGHSADTVWKALYRLIRMYSNRPEQAGYLAVLEADIIWLQTERKTSLVYG